MCWGQQAHPLANLAARSRHVGHEPARDHIVLIATSTRLLLTPLRCDELAREHSRLNATSARRLLTPLRADGTSALSCPDSTLAHRSAVCPRLQSWPQRHSRSLGRRTAGCQHDKPLSHQRRALMPPWLLLLLLAASHAAASVPLEDCQGLKIHVWDLSALAQHERGLHPCSLDNIRVRHEHAFCHACAQKHESSRSDAGQPCQRHCIRHRCAWGRARHRYPTSL